MIADPEALSLTVDAEDSATTAERSVSMGLIVTELVINSLKHAFPGAQARGVIEVGFHAKQDGWVLTVADDEVGLKGDHASGKPGLGTGIVNALAAQLSATVAVTDANPGCLVSVTHASSGAMA